GNKHFWLTDIINNFCLAAHFFRSNIAPNSKHRFRFLALLASWRFITCRRRSLRLSPVRLLSSCRPPAFLPVVQTHTLPKSLLEWSGNFPLAAATRCAIPGPANARGLPRHAYHSASTRPDRSPVSKDQTRGSTR